MWSGDPADSARLPQSHGNAQVRCDDLGMQERLSLNECRKLIGTQAEGLSDEELTILRDGMYDLSNTLVDAYADFRNRAERLDSDATIAVDLVLLALKEKFQDDDAWDATESSELDSGRPGSQQWDWESL
jgi:hypothetical protein